MKRISILGSTGSIGQQAIDVCLDLNYKVCVLVAKSSVDIILEQIIKVRPEIVALENQDAACILREKLKEQNIICEVLAGQDGVLTAAAYKDVDIVLSTLVGIAGLKPTLEAIRQGHTIALANKESLVVAGDLVFAEAAKHNVDIFPVDSEHSAIWQALQGYKTDDIYKIFLTCSGGPFRGKKRNDLNDVSVADALSHPTWAMGRKISIDSSTLMNKAFELIEACHLFQIPEDKIEVIIHPQSVIHSMVEYEDHSVMAQLSYSDMRLPIQYAFTYPNRVKSSVQAFNPLDPKHSSLEFEAVDNETFPAILLAREVHREGGAKPIIFNAANEIAVNLFLEGKIKYLQIFDLIQESLQKVTTHHGFNHYNLEDILLIDEQTRRFAIETGEKWKE